MTAGTRLVVLPDIEELAGVLASIDELLRHVEVDVEQPPPGVDDLTAVATFARLGDALDWLARAPAVQPITPDGRCELGRLQFFAIAADVLDPALDVLDQMARITIESITSAGSLARLLRLDGGADAELLHARLGGRASRRVQLDHDELAAYERLADRLLDAWAPGDLLERFAMMGLS